MHSFSTPRLTAERLKDGDLDVLTKLHLDAEVMEFLGGVRAPEMTAEFLRDNLAHWDNHGFGLWIFRRADGSFVGRAGLRRIVLEEVDELEVAYTLARTEWGVGYASEIAEALVAIWLEKVPSPSLVGMVDPQNSASARVLTKAGLSYERHAMWRGAPVSVFRRARESR